MSQKAVEVLIGKLVTDEAFRRGFQRNRDGALLKLSLMGLDLTPIERDALLSLDLPSCDRFARGLDARLRKVSPGEGEMPS